MKVTDTEEPDLILIQEPYEYQNRPLGIENTEYLQQEKENTEQP
jgi:hypothetical protein